MSAPRKVSDAESARKLENALGKRPAKDELIATNILKGTYFFVLLQL